MKLIAHLLAADPASPRLTVYDESTGARMDFSAQTLDNWAAKIANMLIDELDLDSDSLITLDLPVGWQAAVIALGAITSRVPYSFGTPEGRTDDTTVVFTTLDRFPAWAESSTEADAVLVSTDPFGRGIEESGGTLPTDALDFGPVVRFYGDQFFGDAPSLADVVSRGTDERLLSTGWTDDESFTGTVLAPLAGGGSAVVVTGGASTERLDAIAASEKTTARA